MHVYKIPKKTIQQQKYAVLAASLTLFICVPVFTFAAGKLSHASGAFSWHDVWSVALMLGIPCAMLWLSTNVMESIQIRLEDDRIVRMQNHPFGLSKLEIAFGRRDIGHIREVSRDGLYLRGRNPNGRWIDLWVPRSIENYDDLRTRVAAWHPIRQTWI